MCESDPPLEQPMCVDACTFGALTYEEREKEVLEEKDPVRREEMELAYEVLVKKFGKKKVLDTFGRLAKG
jgi:benzoyl-CoA reductase subunit BamC